LRRQTRNPWGKTKVERNQTLIEPRLSTTLVLRATLHPFMERAARLIRQSKRSCELLADDELLRAVWPTAVGKLIAAHTARIKLVRAKLLVEVEDTIWQHQLFPLSAQILARIRQVTGSNLVQDIEFRVGIPRREPMRAPVRDTLTPSTPLVPDEADNIQDPVLKKIYRLSRKKATA
jgi:hypothetical protein